MLYNARGLRALPTHPLLVISELAVFRKASLKKISKLEHCENGTHYMKIFKGLAGITRTSNVRIPPGGGGTPL